MITRSHIFQKVEDFVFQIKRETFILLEIDRSNADRPFSHFFKYLEGGRKDVPILHSLFRKVSLSLQNSLFCIFEI